MVIFTGIISSFHDWNICSKRMTRKRKKEEEKEEEKDEEKGRRRKGSRD